MNFLVGVLSSQILLVCPEEAARPTYAGRISAGAIELHIIPIED